MTTGVSTITNVAQAARQPNDSSASRKPNSNINFTECLAVYGGKCKGGLKLPETGTILAPWVYIEFEGSGSVITVGNESSPATDPKNVACIKSFEFGYSDGMTVRAVIHDEQGGSFVQFMEHLFKHYATLKFGSPANVRMKFQFGWCKSECGDAFLEEAKSRPFYALCDSVETNLAEGKIIFELTGKDLCYRMLEGGVAYCSGGEGGRTQISITEAITELMTNTCSPCVKSVKFQSIDENGIIKPLEFADNGEKGPEGKWNTNGQNKLEAVRRWLNAYKTKNGNGMYLQYNPEEPGGGLIIWEDRKPKEIKTDAFFDNSCIGTYIKNGGQQSSVIEFNPRIKWDFSRLTNQGGGLSGQTANALKTPGSTTPGTPIQTLTSKENPCTGQNTQSIATENLINQQNKNAVVEFQKANAVNVRAMKVLHDDIEADLVIIGDPTICPPSESIWSKTCTIIVVNPYFLTIGGAGCGDYLAKPVCNEVLSNKGWFVKSITHKIDAGKYTTTLGVYLSAPGIDLPNNAPLGGWTGGWTPANFVIF